MLVHSWGKVVLYQLSYFRIIFFSDNIALLSNLAKVGMLVHSWGKVVLYQLSYFRIYFFLTISLYRLVQ
jgi:hypothetical protein